MTPYGIAALILGLAFSAAGLTLLLLGALRRGRWTDDATPRRVWIVAAVLLIAGNLWLIDIR